MTDSLVLALDTATVVNVGLARGTQVLAAATVLDRMAHAEQLMPRVAEVLSDAGVRVADLDRIVVGLGPGPFTGLRVGVVTAQILATVAGIGLHGVCSLDVLAAEYAVAHPTGEFLVATDARRREVYWARYAPARHPRRRVRRSTARTRCRGARRSGPAVDLYPDQLDGVAGTAGPRILG